MSQPGGQLQSCVPFGVFIKVPGDTPAESRRLSRELILHGVCEMYLGEGGSGGGNRGVGGFGGVGGGG